MWRCCSSSMRGSIDWVVIVCPFASSVFTPVEACSTAFGPGRASLPWARRHLSGVHAVEEPGTAVAGARPRVLAQHALVDVSAPAGRVREPDMTVADDRRPGDQRTLPRHVVDVDLHDPHVGEYGAEVQGVKVGEVAVIVMRSDVDLA